MAGTDAYFQKNKKKEKWRRILPFYILALPGIIYLLINNYIPIYGMVIAFKKFNIQKGIFGSDWYGLKNFEFLFKTNDAWIITRNTICYNIVFFIVGTFLAVTLAILLNELKGKIYSKICQSLTLLPFLMSWVVVSYLGYAFLSSESGLINKSILEPLGLEKMNWYQEIKYWPYILVLINAWKGVGYSMIIYLSSIVGINQDYYEAALIDGSNKWQQITKITLPLLKPTVLTLLILSLGQIFRSDFGLFYQIPRNSGALFPVTRTLDVYVYQALMKNSNYGMSSAASVYQSVVCFICLVGANLVIKKYRPESALF
ncbi:MAG: ABC transporter permease subunit [Spirochaetaceae bacterium]|jgi:putative aldouronate transport system permease protein|nr:ABC transporter permease subunit [Spirochaetaceae bacterium]